MILWNISDIGLFSMSNSILTSEQQLQFQTNGFLMIPNFVREEVCDLLVQRMNHMIHEFNPDEIKTVFSAKDQRHAKELYFLESGDKIRFFFEEGALDNNGQLKFEKSRCINKVGHALHQLDPVFHCFSHSHKIAMLAKDLEISHPRLIQSMYICKQPYIGGEVTCHQDATYLYVKNKPVIGLWFALEDASIKNGCLWAIPKGHQSVLKSRFIRDALNQTSVQIYDQSPWNLDEMVPLEVAKGSVIILHGLLPHMSKQNTSSQSRHAYTLHLMSNEDEYATDNWLQYSPHQAFSGFLST